MATYSMTRVGKNGVFEEFEDVFQDPIFTQQKSNMVLSKQQPPGNNPQALHLDTVPPLPWSFSNCFLTLNSAFGGHLNWHLPYCCLIGESKKIPLSLFKKRKKLKIDQQGCDFVVKRLFLCIKYTKKMYLCPKKNTLRSCHVTASYLYPFMLPTWPLYSSEFSTLDEQIFTIFSKLSLK